jgi:hypothetical protein
MPHRPVPHIGTSVAGGRVAGGLTAPAPSALRTASSRAEARNAPHRREQETRAPVGRGQDHGRLAGCRSPGRPPWATAGRGRRALLGRAAARAASVRNACPSFHSTYTLVCLPRGRERDRRRPLDHSKRSRVTTVRPVLASWYPPTINWRPGSSPTIERCGTSVTSRPRIISSRVVGFQELTLMRK